MPEILLSGCTSAPLLCYLKALGVLKLVSEQADPDTRGAWKGTTFVLRSNLLREDLLDFFLERYEPSPIFAPWNKDGGFQKKGHFAEIMSGSGPRWNGIRDALTDLLRVHDAVIPDSMKVEDRKRLLQARKDELRLRFAAELPDAAVQWLDVCFVLAENEWRSFFLLGSGGVDGRLDFSSTHLLHLRRVIPLDGSSPDDMVRVALSDALFRSGGGGSTKAKVGQFHPSAAGGPNMTTGFGGEGSSLVNSWDYVLGLEGALLVRGGVSRRFDSAAQGRAVFPFTCNALHGLGAQTVDTEKVNIELWLPLWPRLARLIEVRALFTDARARIDGRAAKDSLEMARAAISRGVDRGIGVFQRYQIVQRNGKSHFGIPSGLFRTRDAHEEADLLRDLGRWLDAWHRSTRDASKTPASHVASRRRIDRSVFELCAHGGARRVQDVLVALGRAQAGLGQARRFRADRHLPPLGGLRSDWVIRADDGSDEIALALSLSRLRSGDGEHPQPLRLDIEPVEPRRGGGWAWSESRQDGGLLSGRLPDRLVDLLVRRMQMAAGGAIPLVSTAPAGLAAVRTFLEGGIDEDRLAALTHALLALERSAPGSAGRLDRPSCDLETLESLPRAYALLKLLFVPGGLRRHGFPRPVRVRPEGALLSLLRRGRVAEATRLAARRLRAHGLVPLGRRPELHVPDPLRLAAALLFPISAIAAEGLARLVLAPENPDSVRPVVATVPAPGGESNP